MSIAPPSGMSRSVSQAAFAEQNSPPLGPMWWESSDHPLASPKTPRTPRFQDLHELEDPRSQPPRESDVSSSKSSSRKDLFRRRPTQIQPPSPIRGCIPASRLIPMAFPTFVCAQCLNVIRPGMPTFMATDLTYCSGYCRKKGQAEWPTLSPTSQQAVQQAMRQKREVTDAAGTEVSVPPPTGSVGGEGSQTKRPEPIVIPHSRPPGEIPEAPALPMLAIGARANVGADDQHAMRHVSVG